MAMKINAKVVGYGPDPGRTKALVNIIVEFSGPTETMTLTVIVPNDCPPPPRHVSVVRDFETGGILI
jgi:hypothetical protein